MSWRYPTLAASSAVDKSDIVIFNIVKNHADAGENPKIMARLMIKLLETSNGLRTSSGLRCICSYFVRGRTAQTKLLDSIVVGVYLTPNGRR